MHLFGPKTLEKSTFNFLAHRLLHKESNNTNLIVCSKLEKDLDFKTLLFRKKGDVHKSCTK